MLIQPDKNALGDKILSPVEGVAKLKQEITKLRQKDRLPNQDLINNQDMATGQPMMPEELIRRLGKVSPKLIVEKGGIPNAVAVRLRVTDTDPASDTYGQPIKKYISGFYIDRPLPEWSTYVNDQWGIPVREIRGWRTVENAVRMQGIVPESRLRRIFGEPRGQRSILIQEQMQGRR